MVFNHAVMRADPSEARVRASWIQCIIQLFSFTEPVPIVFGDHSKYSLCLPIPDQDLSSSLLFRFEINQRLQAQARNNQEHSNKNKVEEGKGNEEGKGDEAN